MKLSVVLLVAYINLSCYVIHSADHYWRNYYYNDVPIDALIGGKNSEGSPTYIGQFGVSSPQQQVADLVSAILYTGTGEAYGLYGPNVIISKSNIKILCSANTRNYRWSNTIDRNCNLIEGGSNGTNYQRLSLYIGRSNYRGQNVTGSFSKPDFILNVPWSKTEVVQFESFEMLMYCKI